PPKIMMHAIGSDDLQGRWQLAMLRFKLAKLLLAIDTVGIHNKYFRYLAGRDADVGVRVNSPPSLYDVRIESGILAAIGACRPLGAWPARKYCKTVTYECQRGLQHGNYLSGICGSGAPSSGGGSLSVPGSCGSSRSDARTQSTPSKTGL